MTVFGLIYKFEASLLAKFSDFWDGLAVRRALFLADEPRTILHLPCDSGQFWSLLTEKRERQIVAADSSPHKLVSAWNSHPKNTIERVRLLDISAFSIGLPDGSVDCILSMQYLQLIDDHASRLNWLREFHRVTRESVIISVETNSKTQFLARPEELETEFRLADFSIQCYITRIPLIDFNRVYILRKIDPPLHLTKEKLAI